MDLLDDLGARLRALSDDQPPQPGDRVPTVTRTARRIRRTRGAGATAALAGVIAAAGLVVSSVPHDDSSRFANTDVLTWPDRSYATEREVAQGAFDSWAEGLPENANMASPPHWLFRGRIPLPDNHDEYVAVFTAVKDGLRTLVVASAERDSVDEHGHELTRTPGGSPWLVEQFDEPKARLLDHVGLYLATSVRDPISGGGVNANVLFLLASPEAGQARFLSQHLPGGPVGPDLSTAESANGVFVSFPMTLDGPVDTTVFNTPATWLQKYSFGTGRAQPTLAAARAPDVPPGWRENVSGTGQTEAREDGAWTYSGIVNVNSNPGTALAVLARCYGGGSVRFALSPYSENAPPPAPTAHGDVLCDGGTHQAFPPVRVPGPGFELTAVPDRLQAISFSLGSPG